MSPVGIIKYKEEVITIGNNQVGPMTRKFYDALTDIQYGRVEDPRGWIEEV